MIFLINTDKILFYLEKYLVPFGINLVVALAIFIVGRWVARFLRNTLVRLMLRTRLDESLARFLGSIVYALLLVVVAMAALDRLGVNTTSALAVVGAAGLALGLALQKSLSNFASGVMLIILRPIRKGDLVHIASIIGVIEEIEIFSTTLVTPDGRQVIIPNGQIYGSTITNFTIRGTRRVDLTFGISYDDDLRKAKEILARVVEQDERILADPAPTVAVEALADSSVNLACRPWVKVDDYWGVYFDLQERVKLAFDDAGITIPFPQRDIHTHAGDAPVSSPSPAAA